MTKDQILNNVEDQSATELADAIIQGIITLQELMDTQKLDATVRSEIKRNIQKHELDDHNTWIELRNTKSGCQQYLQKFPSGKYINDAKAKIKEYDKEQYIKEKKRKDIIDNISKNKNEYTPNQIKYYLENNIINTSDLLESGIPMDIIDMLKYELISPELELGPTPPNIPEGYTEVYFWGIPGSGKTCVLGAVLSTAERMGYLEIAQGPGYDYMVKLCNTFTNRFSILPGPTPTANTQYLPFTLKKPREKFSRSISLIELSGEIFECFYEHNAGREITPQKLPTFNSIINFLKSNNRKMHFFFVDYDRENKKDQKGYRQSDYLNAAATFFNNPNYDIFNKTTDAIYIVLTKSDLLPGTNSERVNQIKGFLEDNTFKSFVNSLRDRCKENDINGKRILGTPFTLGSLYFNFICDFNSETSVNIIDILMRRIPPSKKSILDFFNN